MIGINDICYNYKIEDTLKNLENILQKTETQLPTCNIKVFSVLPINRFSLNKIHELNDGYKTICSQYNNAEFIDISNFYLSEGMVNDDLFSEGLHMNSKRYQIFINRIKEVLSE